MADLRLIAESVAQHEKVMAALKRHKVEAGMQSEGKSRRNSST
ncbi:MAG TPA: hypothetical protein VEJ00_06845 [Candidatus Acidoferrales bacterium]|nr:hypothetical protein [Candidatus Acidoferrales bacterium]